MKLSPKFTFTCAPLALVEDDAILPPERPSTGPEIDDLFPGSKPSDGSEIDNLLPPSNNPKPSEYPGVDDGLIPSRDNDNLFPGSKPSDGSEIDNLLPPSNNPKPSEYPGVDDGLIPRRDNDNFPVPASPGFPIPEDPTIPGFGKKLPDINVYQQKKTLAQGMMDLALLTANANQLRYVLDAGSVHTYFYVNLICIIISIVLQIGVGMLLLWNSRFNINKEKHIIVANRINNFTVTGIFLITVLNVFISAFGLPDRSLMMMAPQILNKEVESITDTDNFEVSTDNN